MEFHDSLPYIDAAISDAQRDAATLLIRRETSGLSSETLHPSLDESPKSLLSAALQDEANRAGSGKPMVGGIDLGRYESVDELDEDSNPEIIKAALRTTYINLKYLHGRETDLSLLQQHGKSAWLISNYHLQDIHKRQLSDLSQAKNEVETTNRMRKSAQEEVKGELDSLEETWRVGIDRIIETQIATGALKAAHAST